MPFKIYRWMKVAISNRSEEHTSELQSHLNLVCRLLLEKKKHKTLHRSLTRAQTDGTHERISPRPHYLGHHRTHTYASTIATCDVGIVHTMTRGTDGPNV